MQASVVRLTVHVSSSCHLRFLTTDEEDADADVIEKPKKKKKKKTVEPKIDLVAIEKKKKKEEAKAPGSPGGLFKNPVRLTMPQRGIKPKLCTATTNGLQL